MRLQLALLSTTDSSSATAWVTPKMRYIQLEIPREKSGARSLVKHHDRAVKSLVLQGETIARQYYLSSSAVIRRCIHSYLLIPTLTWEGRRQQLY